MNPAAVRMKSLLIIPAECGGFAVYDQMSYTHQLYYAGTLSACIDFIREFYVKQAAVAVDRERGK